MVEIIKELDNFKDKACLVKHNESFFAVSSLNRAFDTGMSETLVFLCDENGEVTDWGEVAGGRGVSRDEAIKELGEMTTI